MAADDNLRFSASWIYYAGVPMALLYSLAVILLWPQRHTILGLWLMVVAFVHLVGVPLSFFSSPSRFSIGWYTVVIINLVADSLVLVVLLVEVTKLYARVLLAVNAAQRERAARLVTGDAVAAMIAHEVKQPLAAMITRAETGLRRLDRSAPDLDKAKEDIRQIAADGHRAAGIIDSIRANFKKDDRTRTAVDINHLIAETTSFISDDMLKQGIAIRIEVDAASPRVAGDRTQLQQVLLNLLTNAADSMAADEGARVLTVRSELRDDGEVVVSVADTGTGVGPNDIERVFNPLFTTKTQGMGMGLSICRSIIEAHGGHIWVTPHKPKGAAFQFTLSLLLMSEVFQLLSAPSSASVQVSRAPSGARSNDARSCVRVSACFSHRLSCFSLQIRLDGKDETRVVVDYHDLDHAYASAVPESQGSTVDQTFSLASRFFDRHSSCVALSQIDNLFHSRQEFSGRAARRQRIRGQVSA